MLKVGDRVIVGDANGRSDDSKKLNGLIGTIIYIEGYMSVTIEFDDYIRGHDGHNRHIKGKDGHCWVVAFDRCKKIEEDIKPVKIKWYKKGKLEENKLFESKEDIGRRVRMISHKPDYLRQAFTNNSKGLGRIIDYYGEDLYEIHWDNGNINIYTRKDFEFLDEEDIKPIKIKWYKKGKLEENKLFENKENMNKGDRVKVINHSRQLNNKVGTIVDINDWSIGVEFDEYMKGHNCKGKGKDGHCYYFNYPYVEKIEDEYKPVKIKWYKKGKLEENLIKKYNEFI